MAEVEQQQQQQTAQDEEQMLKHLDFVQIAALRLVGCFSRVYDFAKEKSGPLRPGVQTLEGTVKTVVGPVYDKFHDVPLEILKFVDRKVDESFSVFECHVDPRVKEASDQVFSAAQKAPSMVRAVASEVNRAGVVGTATGVAKTVYTSCEPTAKGLYTKYEPVAEQCAVTTWRKLHSLPLFPQVANVVVPTAASLSEKYNIAVDRTVERGCVVSSYLPLVPTERIAKVFGESGPTNSSE